MEDFPQMFMLGGLRGGPFPKQENVVQKKLDDSQIEAFDKLKKDSDQINKQFDRLQFIAFKLNLEYSSVQNETMRSWSNLLGGPVTSCTIDHCHDSKGNTWSIKDGLLYKEETLGK